MTLEEDIKHSTAANSVAFWIIIAIVFIALCALGLVLYWVNVKYDPLVFRDETNQPVKEIVVGNTNNEVQNGGYLILLPNFCKTIEGEGEVNAELIGSSTKTDLNWPKDRSSKNCYPNDVATFKLPTVLNPEPKRICFTITYHPNPIRTVEEYICTEQFTIK